MFDYGFSNYESKTVLDKTVPIEDTVAVMGGKQAFAEVAPEKKICVFGKKNRREDIKIVFKPNEKVRAPLKEGDILGIISVYKNGVKAGEVKGVCHKKIEAKTYFDYIGDLAGA